MNENGEGAKGVPETARRRRAVRLPDIFLAAILMVSIHLFWVIWLRPEPIRAAYPAGLRGPRLIYAPPMSGSVNRLWSPVLLSLPSPAGFSGRAIPDAIDLGPALSWPVKERRFMERSAWGPVLPPGLSARRSGTDRADWLQPRVAVPDAGRGTEPAAHKPGATLRVRDGLTQDDLASIEIPGSLEREGDVTWRANAWIEFDDDGHVSHVFMEQSSGNPERDRDLLRSLYRWRVKPDRGVRGGRVDVLYERGPGEGMELSP